MLGCADPQVGKVEQLADVVLLRATDELKAAEDEVALDPFKLLEETRALLPGVELDKTALDVLELDIAPELTTTVLDPPTLETPRTLERLALDKPSALDVPMSLEMATI